MKAALQFLLGDESADTLAALRAEMWRWASQEGAGDARALGRYLGLRTPASTRLALRDAHLREAALLILDEIRRGRRCDLDDSITDVSETLASAAETLEKTKWSEWRHFDTAPAHADAVDRALWSARQLGGEPLPSTARQYRNILRRETDTAMCFPTSEDALEPG